MLSAQEGVRFPIFSGTILSDLSCVGFEDVPVATSLAQTAGRPLGSDLKGPPDWFSARRSGRAAGKN